MSVDHVDVGRREHYRAFYDASARPDEGSPLLVVTGNCQAESLRILLDPSGGASVRVPPVFELLDADLPHLESLLARTTHLLAQPVHDDYRGLPIGTAQQVAGLGAGARSATAPIIRYAGLHPFHVVHHPPDGLGGPPVVPYHDLRTLRAFVEPDAPPPPAVTTEGVRTVAAASVAELRRREEHLDTGVADVLTAPRADDMRTVNHPGERPLLALARRAATVLGLERPGPADRPLLDAVVAPLEPVVAATWGLDASACRETWSIDGAEVGVAEVGRAHLAWYAEHPDVAHAVWARFAPAALALGLGTAP